MRPPDPHLGMDGWVLCRLYHDLLVPRALPDIGRPTDLGSACNFDEVGRALFSVMVDGRCPLHMPNGRGTNLLSFIIRERGEGGLD